MSAGKSFSLSIKKTQDCLVYIVYVDITTDLNNIETCELQNYNDTKLQNDTNQKRDKQ